MKINIVGGRGVMGQIHAKALANQGHEILVTGRNSTPSPIEAAKISDITIISVPLSNTEQVIKEVAPFCKAIADFSSVKIKPIEWMEKHASPSCEILGLHPLYGETDSIKGKTIVFCKTKTTGRISESIINSLKNEGAELIELTPEKHDLIVNALAQNSRTILLETFGDLLRKHQIDIKEFYKLAPSPTKIILDLLSRQVNEQNDELYLEMKKLNPYQEKITTEMKEILQEKIKKDTPANIRNLFGEELKDAQERAKKRINFKV